MSDYLNLLYVHNNSMGYGRMGTQLAAAVERAGVNVFDGLPSRMEIDPQDGRVYGKASTVCWLSVPTHAMGWYRAQHPVVFTMWEATVLPPTFRENIHEFETVIVPSEQNVELFSRYHDNVQLCYLGVDAEKWRFQPRTMPTTRFNFLIGGSGSRKGTDLAVKAFINVFGDEGSWPKDGPVPYLIRKSPKPEDLEHHPRIELVAGRISDDEEVDLYASAHVYLQPSRGEGFGLQPLQAIAQGCPTILTDAHGHAGFSHLGIGLSSTLSPAAYFIYGDSGDWWEPDFDELCDAMRWTYDNYADAVAMAEHGSREAHKTFTWDRVADRFLSLMPDLSLYTGSDEIVTPTSKLYPATSKIGQRFDAGGTMYVFRPGETLYVPADVKRWMYEAGTLDPSSITGDDDGLLPQQVAAKGGYIAAHQNCPTCLQPLNGGDRSAEEQR